MPADFLDTSALAKHYHAEAGSSDIDLLWNDPSHSLFVSRLSALEIFSVFAGKVRAGIISITDVPFARGTDVEVLICPKPMEPDEFLDSWRRVCRDLRTPPLHAITDEEIQLEIDDYRADR